MKPTDIPRLRQRIAALQTERAALAAAPPDRAERIAQITEHCRRMALAADARIGYAVASDDLAGALNVRATQAGNVDLAPVLAALLSPDVLASALARHVPEDTGPDAATRAARMVAIDAELDRLGHAEEDLIEAAEARGETALRRPDADPAIVLRVKAAT